MQAVLVMFRSDGERRSFSVTREVTVIGRREDCDLRIPLNDVSRKHARLIKEDDGMRVEDLGSSNGTYLNGQRVEREAVLQAGDSIQVGPVVFVLQVDGWPSDEELNPVTAESATSAAMFAPAAVPTAPGIAAPEVVDPDGLEPLPLGDDPTTDYGAPAEYVPGEAGADELELEPIALDDAPAEEAGHGGSEPIPLIGEDELLPLTDDVAPAAHGHGDELQPLDDDSLLLELEPEEPKKH